jgi:hypothetical protein
VKTEAGYWYINGKFRHRLKNKRVLDSWNFAFLVPSSEAALAKYPRAKPLGFRDGSLVRDISDGKVYLISEKSRRLITRPEAYDLLGLKRRNAIWAAHDEIILHPEGEVL